MWGSCFFAWIPPAGSRVLLLRRLLRHSLHSLTHSLTHRRSTQSLLDELRRAWPPLGVAAAGPRLPFAWQAQAAFRVAGAVHRPPGRAAGARGGRWGPAAAFRVAGTAVHRASWTSCGAQWPPLGPRLITAPLPHTSTSHTSLLTSSPLTSLITSPLITAPLLTPHSHISQHNSSQLRGQQTAFRVAGVVHRASWTSCGARGRR